MHVYVRTSSFRTVIKNNDLIENRIHRHEPPVRLPTITHTHTHVHTHARTHASLSLSIPLSHRPPSLDFRPMLRPTVCHGMPWHAMCAILKIAFKQTHVLLLIFLFCNNTVHHAQCTMHHAPCTVQYTPYIVMNTCTGMR